MPGSHRVLESHAPVEGNHGHSLKAVLCVEHNASLEFGLKKKSPYLVADPDWVKI